MNKEFIPYEQALELKQLGFDEPCLAINNGDKLFYGAFKSTHAYYKEYAVILYQQAFRWFREKHDLVHHINRDGGWWLCSILDLYDEKEQGAIETHIDNCYPDTYEEAELACLKKLIELVKNK